MKLLRHRTGALLWLVFCVAVARAQTVYDNLQNVRTNVTRFNTEYGDDVNLVGQAREVVQFAFLYFAEAGATNGSATIRFYANDGTLFDPNSVTSQRPRTLLWESGTIPILAGVVTNLLEVPNIIVPDRFTWTIDFQGVSQAPGQGAGLLISDPVSIGAVLPGVGRPVVGSYNDYWIRQPSGDWALGGILNDPVTGALAGNFAASVTAVPEPGVVALGVSGLAFGLVTWWRSRFRR
jgi:hypothetical protein